ncbi:hypothetical protein MPTK1_5g01210 [Marchantia polymorpha subsp. ruderalis]|uniref:Sel1 repeat family protein n=2 Tax=Marchantia polymorpha TaxID=3197 RepID=A0AAF6BDP6_MARPO|nr:hypothetical protein MARPO_0197s0015 [Marchantia polymorpha]BBN10130.1 hypothetical protein Mp_5g01210 [Marchantia polymorpha subsp. ruderalis]|eukprot:PTQ27471.1 hypothetical protein MARPO_0197s0015 [Marchantia polymorpha]
MRTCLGCTICEKVIRFWILLCGCLIPDLEIGRDLGASQLLMSKKSESKKEEALRSRGERVPLKDVVADCERRWFEATLKAARSGDVSMQSLVGQMFCSGYGVAPDLKKGRLWLQKSAEVDKDARVLLASLAESNGEPWTMYTNSFKDNQNIVAMFHSVGNSVDPPSVD